MMIHLSIVIAPALAAGCTYEAHAHTIAPHVQQELHCFASCTSVATCHTEAGEACTAMPNCSSFGISPIWHGGLKAQLYSTHWNESYSNQDWTLYACAGDSPPSAPTPPPPKPPPPPTPAPTPLPPRGPCATDLDCSLNGLCDAASGKCACAAPWKTGPSASEFCNVLDVLPHPVDYVPAYGGPRTDTAYGPQNVTSWGGNIIKGNDGLYHLWVSRMGGGAGLNGWTSVSQIDHAVSSDPMGVFALKDTALKKEAHNASPLRAANGSFLIFHIGSGHGGDSGSGFLHHR